MPSPALSFRTLLFAGLLFMHQIAVGQAQENPSALSVAVSIKPLHSLISSLMEGTGSQPSLIVSGGASPHAYSLKPSDARKLATAQLVFWIGPGMESFLVKPMQSLAGKAGIVTFVPRAETNPHIWLSPIKARAMVETAVARLAVADPGNADVYRRNGARLDKRLGELQAESVNALRAIAAKPFIVYHDAYDHLAAAFGLTIAGMVTTNPERAPGAGRIAQLRALMKARAVSCLFAEPQVDTRRLNMIVENVPNARVEILDPLGTDIPPGGDMYFTLMRANVRALVDCLSGQ